LGNRREQTWGRRGDIPISQRALGNLGNRTAVGFEAHQSAHGRSRESQSQIVTFRPFADYAWGIRPGRDGERALIARGNRGVRLELAGGSFLVIGSRRPEELGTALENALRPGA